MKHIYAGFCILISLTFFSCFNDEVPLKDYWMDYATVDSLGLGVYYLKLDNGETMWPAAQDIHYEPKQRERIFINYTKLEGEKEGFDHCIRVNNISVILTKPCLNLSENLSDSLGYNPVEFENQWLGGGFVNIKLSFLYGSQIAHMFNLARNFEKEQENQLYLEFRHNSYGDFEKYKAITHVAFDILPLVENVKDSIQIIIESTGFKETHIHKLMYKKANIISTN